jgi:hypothetical protein
MVALELDQIETERADNVCPPELNKEAFRAAWIAMQNCPIDLVADSDDEQCRTLGAGIAAYLAASSTKPVSQ